MIYEWLSRARFLTQVKSPPNPNVRPQLSPLLCTEDVRQPSQSRPCASSYTRRHSSWWLRCRRWPHCADRPIPHPMRRPIHVCGRSGCHCSTAGRHRVRKSSAVHVSDAYASNGHPLSKEFRSQDRQRRYTAYWAAAQAFTPSLRTTLLQGTEGVTELTRGVS